MTARNMPTITKTMTANSKRIRRRRTSPRKLAAPLQLLVTLSLFLSSQGITQLEQEQQQPQKDCATCPQNLTILVDDSFSSFDSIQDNAIEYMTLYPHIQITVTSISGSNNKNSNKNNNAQDIVDQLQFQSWDASIVPSFTTGALLQTNSLADLTDFVQDSHQLDWPDVLDHSRHYNAQYGPQVRVIPLEQPVLQLYYRRDLFANHGIQVPRTWQEYTDVSKYFHGLPLGPNNTALFGSCGVSRIRQCGGDTDWTFAMLSSMTQALGTESGFLLSQHQLDPLLGSAMDEVLRYTSEQHTYGHTSTQPITMELTRTSCQDAKLEFHPGKCAMTYNWGYPQSKLMNNVVDPFPDNIFDPSPDNMDIGIAPTPGSRRVLNRATGRLVNCTAQLCPHAVDYPDLGLVNVAPYAGSGGFVAGISNQIPNGRQLAAANFLAYISSNGSTVTSTSVFQPNRYSQLHARDLVDRGLNPTVAQAYIENTRQQLIDSPNAVAELRIPGAISIRDVMDDEIFKFAFLILSADGLSEARKEELIRTTTQQIDNRIRRVLRNEEALSKTPLIESYEMSLGIFLEPSASENFIDQDFRQAGWGMAGIICAVALFLIPWTIKHRNKAVMQAANPYLLVQACVGIFFCGATIAPLSLDDSLVSVEVLNYTCMLSPWLYVVGYTILFSSVYAKIRQCRKVYSDPNFDVLEVDPRSAWKFCIRLLIVNGSILAVWTVVDPLQWIREEIYDAPFTPGREPDTFGMCKGEDDYWIIFAALLFAVNMSLSAIAMVQAFKCRCLVLEFNDMQWLPLTLFPFMECWVVGGPILFLTQHEPTHTFIVLTLVITVSSIAALLALFAPKEWYVRKFQDAAVEHKSRVLSKKSSVGNLVLKHPEVVAEKELERLKNSLDDVISSSIELEHEIVTMQAKLKEEKPAKFSVPKQSGLQSARSSILDTTSSVGQDAEELERSHSDCGDIVAMEAFEKVWAMEDEEDGEEPKVVMPLHIAPTMIEHFDSNSSIGRQAEGVSQEIDAIRTTDVSLSTAPGSEWDYRASSIFDEDRVSSLPVSPPNTSTSIYEDSLSSATPEPRVCSSQTPLQSAPPPPGIDQLPTSPDSYNPSVFEDSPARDYAGPMSDSSSSMGSSVHAPEMLLSKPHATGTSDPLAALRGTGESPPSSPEPGCDERVVGLTASICTTEDGSSAAIDSSPEPDSYRGLNHSNYDRPSATHSSSNPPISRALYLSSDESSASGDSNTLIRSKDLKGLGKVMETDDLASIEARASSLAETFKGRLSMSKSQSDFRVDFSTAQPAKNSTNDVSAKSGDNAPEELKPREIELVIQSGLMDSPIDISKITVDHDASYGNLSSVYLDLSQGGPTVSKSCSSVEDHGSTSPHFSFDASSATHSHKSQGVVASKSGSTSDDYSAPFSHGSFDASSETSSREDSQTSSREEIVKPSAGESTAAEEISYVTFIESMPAAPDSPVGPLTQKAGEATQGDSQSVGRSESDATSDDESIEIVPTHELNRGGAYALNRGAVIEPDSKAAKIARFKSRIASSGVNRTTDSGVGATNNRSKMEATSSREDHRQHQDSKAAKIARFRNRIAPAVAESSNRADVPEHENELSPRTSPAKAELALSSEQKSPDSKASKIARFRSRIGAPLSDAPRYSKAAKLLASEDEHMQPKLKVAEDEFVKAIERGQERSKLSQPKSPTKGTSSSSVLGDWLAVGATASMLADWSDSQSCSSRTDTLSASSMDATRQASALDTPFASELDKLVGSLDWDGVRLAAERFESTEEDQTPHEEEKPPLDVLEEIRQRKRELESWRESIKKSISKSS